MNISNILTEKKLQEILVSFYEKGNQSLDIKPTDIVNEIKQTILTADSSD
ncbi:MULTISPECIES: hypothetical protein [Priestia]|nr:MULTISPECIES: hypothetical protein [Priestia]MBX9994231.1 hypothetical protein [Priestia aryabhattai]MEB4869804.1 hypothetical protein [Priestia megaterium]MED3960171.1 hypothetical protein [Priestia aryabhattai]MED3992446.1 hypothetical protein [Priestia aryabhattai]MED4008613.1 hypothetical protein [Priestia aryabhattai]